METKLPDADAAAVEAALETWTQTDGTRRLLSVDAALWTGSDEARWLGWLHAPETWTPELAHYRTLADGIREDGVRHALLLGMGGSSLCCEVLARTFGSGPGCPILEVVDSTVPSQIRAVDERIDPRRTICFVSSKSGSTIETDVARRHFFERIRDPQRFIAITDPGSGLEKRATEEGWRAVAHGEPEIGGRFSALSPFGLLPAAVLGIDVEDLLGRARRLAGDVAPALELGVMLGALAAAGRDKLTLVLSPGLASLGAWLEQLIAESTGKNGRGIVPVDGEGLAASERYGRDRTFAYVRLASAPDPDQDHALEALAAAGQPVLRIDVESPAELGAEFYRWQIATAAAGAVLGVNPFDQPDVEAAKVAARGLVTAYEESGELPESAARLSSGALSAYADDANAAALGPAADLQSLLAAHLGRIGAGDYLALNAFVERCDAHAAPLEALRHRVRDATGAATTLGFGPRFLHSTGQLHKGGPNSAVVLEVTAHDAEDLPIPGQRMSFGVLKDAQSRGDFDVLCERKRRALRVHVAEGDVTEGLEVLAAAVDFALA